jgi:hypothetical protein
MSGRDLVDCGLSKAQRKVIRSQATTWLVDKAEDLELLSNEKDPDHVVEEVAALGLLIRGLEDGEVAVPDGVAREMIARRTTETELLDRLREAKEEYGREQAEHDAWDRLLGVIERHEEATDE